MKRSAKAPVRPSATHAEPDPIGADARAARRASKLPPAAACVLCGEIDLRALYPRPVPRSQLAQHHVLGRQHDPACVVTLCLNCHAKVTADQLDADVPLTARSNVLERLAAATRSLRTFTTLMDDAHRRQIERLDALMHALDVAHPTWRSLPEAQ